MTRKNPGFCPALSQERDEAFNQGLKSYGQKKRLSEDVLQNARINIWKASERNVEYLENRSFTNCIIKRAAISALRTEARHVNSWSELDFEPVATTASPGDDLEVQMLLSTSHQEIINKIKNLSDVRLMCLVVDQRGTGGTLCKHFGCSPSHVTKSRTKAQQAFTDLLKGADETQQLAIAELILAEAVLAARTRASLAPIIHLINKGLNQLIINKINSLTDIDLMCIAITDRGSGPALCKHFGCSPAYLCKLKKTAQQAFKNFMEDASEDQRLAIAELILAEAVLAARTRASLAPIIHLISKGLNQSPSDLVLL
jgi:Rieske Fe-S protein